MALERVEIRQEPGDPLADRFRVEGTAASGRAFSLDHLVDYYQRLAGLPGVSWSPAPGPRRGGAGTAQGPGRPHPVPGGRDWPVNRERLVLGLLLAGLPALGYALLIGPALRRNQRWKRASDRRRRRSGGTDASPP